MTPTNIWKNGLSSDMNISASRGILLLICIFIICYMLTAGLMFVLTKVLAGNAAASLRIGAIAQDVLMFILPAVAVALICTRRPAQLLCLIHNFNCNWVLIFLVVALFLVSIPFLEAIIYWNYHWTWLPPEIDALARNMEEASAQTIKVLMGNNSIMSLIVNILIIGVAAGFSEEIFFRGALLNLTIKTRVGIHLSVWIVAFIFSAMHFQPFGFVPRMLLGAYFGYLLVWSKSLWLPITAHILNNATYVVTAWCQSQKGGLDAIDTEPTLWSTPYIVLSAAATVTLLFLLWRNTRYCRLTE